MFIKIKLCTKIRKIGGNKGSQTKIGNPLSKNQNCKKC